MKSSPLRILPPKQTDLFDVPASQAPQTSLQLQRDELVELLSQLLWQVASQCDISARLESDYEQNQS